MKVQFIFMNFDSPVGPSIGVSYLSSFLKQAGHETSCLHINEWVDYPYDPERIVRDIKAYDPGLIAFSFGANHYPETKHLCKVIKESGIKAPILCGGIHTTLNTAEVMSDPNVDFANIGEGDDSIVDLANALEQGGEAPLHVPNVWARRNGAIIQNRARRFKDITHLPFMDTDIWDFQKIMDSRRGWVNVYFNRGCPYRCTYCHNNGEARVFQREFGTKTGSNSAIGYLRYRDPRDMIDELKYLMSRYDVKAFSFNDDTFTMNKEQMKVFLPMYAREIGLPWVCNTTVLDVDEEVLTLMAEANCDLIRYGVESATDRIKKHILKRVFTTDKTREAFRLTRKVGIRSFAYLILANPGETHEEMLATLKLAAELRCDGLKVSLGYPMPGTEYGDICEELGLVDHEHHYHNFIRDTKLLWTDEEWLQLDKLRSVYWWWMNTYLENECSGPYQELIDRLLAISPEEWKHPATEQRVLDWEEPISKEFREKKITHWTIPFKDRPEIAILTVGDDFIEYEALDPH